MAYIKKVNPYGHFDKQAKQYFHTETQRRQWMKDNHMADAPPRNDRIETRKAIEEINADRHRRGQKPMTSARIVGDSPAQRYLKSTFVFSNNPLAKKGGK